MDHKVHEMRQHGMREGKIFRVGFFSLSETNKNFANILAAAAAAGV
jgi:hypothetical protein